jgi:type 1 fimbria pilin
MKRSITMHRTQGLASLIELGKYALCLLMAVMGWLPGSSHAQCSWLDGSTETVSMAINGSTAGTFSNNTITLTSQPAVGTILATSSFTTPSPSTSESNCNNDVASGLSGLTPVLGGTTNQNPGTNGYVFPTGTPGIGFEILHGTSSSYYTIGPFSGCSGSNCTIGSGVFSVQSALYLVVTGTIAPGATVSAGQLAQWYNGSLYVEGFNLSNTVRIVMPACSINTSPQTVTLPTVAAKEFGGKGSTAGTTAFSIALTCLAAGQSPESMSITFTAAGTASGITGVLTPTSGSATGVGVRLLQSDYQTPVTFGTAISEGTPASGSLNLPFVAQYYQTATTVAAGSLTASATFTLTYQ